MKRAFIPAMEGSPRDAVELGLARAPLLVGPLLLALGLACDGGGSAPPGPAAIAAGDAWTLPGTPVVKLAVIAPGELAALTERHAHAQGTDGSIDYVLDHPRQVVVLRKGGGAPQELAALRQGEVLADIAPGPDAGSLWVLAVRWNTDAQVFEPRLALFAGEGAKVEVASHPLEPGRFEELDGTAPPEIDSRYQPGEDTLDVYRMASAGTLVGLVGRNGVGTVFADRYRYRDGQLERTARVALAGPFRGIRTAMTGGSYDVMGWLVSRYRVHAAMSPGGTLHAAVTLNGAELAQVDALFGTSWVDQLGSGDRLATEEAVVFRLSPDGETTPAGAQVLGQHLESLFLGLTPVGEERCLGAGLSREHAGLSHPILFEAGGSLRTFSSTHGSAAFQAVAVDALGRVMAGGSWDWSQNPAGLSIFGGSRFVSPLPAEGEAWPERNLLQGGRRRSEVRSLVEPAAGVWCAGGMDDGPDTHAADGDASLLEADGFVECRAWEAASGGP